MTLKCSYKYFLLYKVLDTVNSGDASAIYNSFKELVGISILCAMNSFFFASGNSKLSRKEDLGLRQVDGVIIFGLIISGQFT